jgi:(p)ppGpp synthase/HD superfamily hydrolase
MSNFANAGIKRNLQIGRDFGETVANIVNGASRITHIRYGFHPAHAANNLRKPF